MESGSKEKNGLTTRGRTFTGLVKSDKMSKTVSVEWERRVYVPKYERYERKRSRVKAHNPENIGAKKGDHVVIKETRPISKTKNFIVIEIIGKETKSEAVKSEGRTESKETRTTKKKEQAKNNQE